MRKNGHVRSRAGFGPLSISTIGEELTITGDVTSRGELHINGQVQGDVYCVALVLGENALLEGNVVAEDVTVRGRLIGSVRAVTVTLEANSRVEGNLFHTRLYLEQGTHFEGESHPSKDPLSSGPKVLAVEPPLNDNRPKAVKHPERRKKFMTSLPELRSA